MLLTDYFAATRRAESGGNDAARNPLSTATGRYQFLAGTWADLARRHPHLGLTPDGRTDPAQQERAMQAFTAENKGHLTSAGVNVTPGTLYAAHFLGPGGAADVLRRPDSARLVDVLPSNVISANPHLRNMTVADFRTWSNRQGGMTGNSAAQSVADDAMRAVGRAPIAPQSGPQGQQALSTGGTMQQQPQNIVSRLREGGVRGLLSDPEFMENAAMAFNTLRMRPDPNLGQSIESERQRRGQAAEQGRASAEQAELMQQTMGWLQANGAPPEIMQGVAVGAIPPNDAVDMVLARMQPQESYQQVFGRDLGLQGEAAETMFNVGPNGKITQIGGSGVNITTNVGGETGPRLLGNDGLVAIPDPNDPSGWRFGVAPNSPEERARADSEMFRDRAAATTERQIVPTIDEIQTARDLASSRIAGMAPTGQYSSFRRRLPFIGQRVADLETTLAGIKSGTALENLNQMRQSSPTGAALGSNVSDKQSGLLEDAYGSLDVNQSPALFLYNLSRVENVLNDIVHGPDGGPERHNLSEMREELRKELGINPPPPLDVWGGERPASNRQQQAQPEQPAPPPQVGEVVDGYRFMGGDPANPNSWQKVQE